MEIWNSAAWYNYYKSQTLGIPTFDWSFNTSNTNNGCIIILEMLGEISFFVHIYLKSKIFQKKIIKKKKGKHPFGHEGTDSKLWSDGYYNTWDKSGVLHWMNHPSLYLFGNRNKHSPHPPHLPMILPLLKDWIIDIIFKSKI